MLCDLTDTDLAFAWWSYLAHVDLSTSLLKKVPCEHCGVCPKYLLADGNWFARSHLPDYPEVTPQPTAWRANPTKRQEGVHHIQNLVAAEQHQERKVFLLSFHFLFVHHLILFTFLFVHLIFR